MKKRRTLATKSILHLLILCLVSAFFYVPMTVEASDTHTATFSSGTFRKVNDNGTSAGNQGIYLNGADSITAYVGSQSLYVDMNFSISIPDTCVSDFSFVMPLYAVNYDTYAKVSVEYNPVLTVGDITVDGTYTITGSGFDTMVTFNFNDVSVPVSVSSCSLSFEVVPDSSLARGIKYQFWIAYGKPSACVFEYSYISTKPPLEENQIAFDEYSSFEVTNYEDYVRKSSYQIYTLPWTNVSTAGGDSSNGLTVLQCNFLSSDKPPDNSYCEYDMSLRFDCTGARLIDYEVLTDGYDDLNIRVLAEDNGSYLITFTGYSEFSRSNMGFDVVFKFSNLGAPLAQGITFSGHLTYYPSSEKDTVAKGFNDVMNGFDSSSGNQSHSKFENGVAEYESAEGSLFSSAQSGMDGYTFFDFSSIPAMLTGLTFVTSIMTSIFNSMGGASGAGIVLSVLFSVMLVAMAIGLYRYFVSSGRTNKKGGD